MGGFLLAIVFVASGVTMVKRAGEARSASPAGSPRAMITTKSGLGLVLVVIGVLVAVYAGLSLL